MPHVWIFRNGIPKTSDGPSCVSVIIVPAVAADFDSSRAIGRISAWVSGEIDFQVLQRENGEDVLFRHAKVSKMDGLDLDGAYADFLRLMLNPDSAVSMGTGKQ